MQFVQKLAGGYSGDGRAHDRCRASSENPPSRMERIHKVLKMNYKETGTSSKQGTARLQIPAHVFVGFF